VVPIRLKGEKRKRLRNSSLFLRGKRRKGTSFLIQIPAEKKRRRQGTFPAGGGNENATFLHCRGKKRVCGGLF